MSYFNKFVILACFIQAIVCQQEDTLSSRTVNNDLKCYVCQESTTQGCRDPIDTTYLKKQACNTLNYPAIPRRDGANMEPVKNLLLQDVFGNRERIPSRIIIEYECIKFVENNGVERSCIPKPANIENACDYFKKEKPSLKSCDTCTTDDCNGSIKIGQSVFMIPVAILAVFKLF